ncbi:hypothetical protein LAZ40_09525 [Cereibacter sphaeroides]|uniref:hypothetical protein n=1 Tax=Cereibacter sphaeroides TaxID=1063 RepID=UPI001F315B64|nr:hypothetical protein [Cereibacter sphaeroides]MCE6959292.1 hypothetical protein [Cereibacter sphaeroides]MCE6972884.1 hypothetical protein [Cereibacter sphaeroides]
MKTPVTHESALAQDPKAVRQAAAELNRHRFRAGKPAIDAEACRWHYSWCGRTGQPSEAGFSDIGATLVAQYGKLSGSCQLNAPEAALALDRVPPEIVAARNPPRVTPENVPHIVAVQMAPNAEGVAETLLVTGGYRSEDRLRLVGVTVGEPLFRAETPCIYAPTRRGPVLEGGLFGSLLDRYGATPEGGTFTWRNRILRRLTCDEILSRLQPAPEGDGPEPS